MEPVYNGHLGTSKSVQMQLNYNYTNTYTCRGRQMPTHTYTQAQYHKQQYVMHVHKYIQLDTWLNLLQKSIDILNKNTPGVKKR